MKKLLQTFVENTFLYLYWILLKIKFKKKPSLIKNFPLDIFQVFNNINETKIFNKKIILPYEDVDFFKRFQMNIPYEILEVDVLSRKSKNTLNIKKETKNVILPIALLNNKKYTTNSNDELTIFSDTKSQNLKLKHLNRFHYLPIKSSHNIKEIKIISGQNKLAIGKPICISKKEKGTKPKIVVQIFIDALAQTIIEKFGYEIMPNTVKYFKNNGTFYTNTYAQSEWTLSSMAGIFTGKYTNEHLIYHPRENNKIKHETLADVLSKNGYYTYACTNNPKLTPENGFDKGFDRYIYASQKDYNYILNEALEQLDSLRINQYLFLGFFDIHESHLLPPISAQLSNDFKDFQFKPLSGNSKDTTPLYDNERIAFYKNNITHFDKKLKLIYQKINEIDCETKIILHSDHGVNFMSNTRELLGKEREKVVFLYENSKHTISNIIKEIRELPSMICSDLNIDHHFNYAFKNYSVTESLYPSKDYEIAIRNKDYVLFFKVNWKDVEKRKKRGYKYYYTIHPLDNESIILNKCDKEKYLLKIAYSIYEKLIDNLNSV